MRKSLKKSLTTLLVLSLCLGLCGGCSGLKYHDIFVAGLVGAAVGGVVGYQSDECPEGIAVGVAVFVTGELLRQIDQLNEEKVEEAEEEVSRGNDLLSQAHAEP